MDDFFVLEIGLVEVAADVVDGDTTPEWSQLGGQFTAFETDYAVGQCMTVLMCNTAPHPPRKFGQRRNGTRNNEIEGAVHLFGTSLYRLHIFQTELPHNILNDTDFFADRVNQQKAGVWMEDGQRDARETTSGADVKNPGSG